MNNPSSSPSDRLQKLLPDLMVRTPRLQEVSYLRLKLSQTEQGLLSMAQVRESMLVPAQKISPVPNMSEAFLGLMSSRNQVFGVIDLSQALGLTSGLKARQVYQIVVMNTAEKFDSSSSLLGLAVSKIEGVSRLPEVDLLPAPNHLSPDTRSAIAGQVTLDSVFYLLLNPFKITAIGHFARSSRS